MCAAVFPQGAPAANHQVKLRRKREVLHALGFSQSAQRCSCRVAAKCSRADTAESSWTSFLASPARPLQTERAQRVPALDPARKAPMRSPRLPGWASSHRVISHPRLLIAAPSTAAPSSNIRGAVPAATPCPCPQQARTCPVPTRPSHASPAPPRSRSRLCRCVLFVKLQGRFGMSDPRSGSLPTSSANPEKGSSQTLLLLHRNHPQIPCLNSAPTPQTRQTIRTLCAPSVTQIFSVPIHILPSTSGFRKTAFTRGWLPPVG